VEVHERTNIMRVDSLRPCPHTAVVDLSFRSIVGAVPHILELVKENWLLSLIKPQFEWREPNQDFNGVVRDPKILSMILLDLVDRLWDEGCFVVKAMKSPIRGRRGNIEFFFLIRSEPGPEKVIIRDKIDELARE
jgi:23S rRNA (cytidine1920-2'-O)/16S rRNA (cytidine1409-2'-O)-methyltransferase